MPAKAYLNFKKLGAMDVTMVNSRGIIVDFHHRRTILPWIFIVLCFVLHARMVNADISVNSAPENLLTFEPEQSTLFMVADFITVNISYGKTKANIGDTVFLRASIAPDVIGLDRVDYPNDASGPADPLMFTFKQDGNWTCENCNVTVRAVFLGIAYLQFDECRGRSDICLRDSATWVRLSQRYEILVQRAHRVVDTVFTVVMVIFSCLINLGMGCKIDLGVVKETMRRPIAPTIGFFCQFLFMPLVSIWIRFIDIIYQIVVKFTLGPSCNSNIRRGCLLRIE